jgi:hypothetical protein
MEIGTVCMFSERRVAVTMTSSRVAGSVPALSAALVVAALAMDANELLPKMAAIAQVSLVFIGIDPLGTG